MASVAEMPMEQELQDKGITTMSAIATSSNNANSSGNNQASPRNTVTSSTMSTGSFVQLGSVEVPKSLQDGEKFVKWDEVSYFPIVFVFNFETIVQRKTIKKKVTGPFIFH